MNDNHWRRKQQRTIMFWVVLLAVLLSAAIGAIMLFVNYEKLH